MKKEFAMLIAFMAAGNTVNASRGVKRKAEFERRSVHFLRQLAKDAGLDDGTYDVRFNCGGFGVSGDATLHHEHVYISYNADGICPWILIRSCKGRKDYTGGCNQQQQWADLKTQAGYDAFVERVKKLAGV